MNYADTLKKALEFSESALERMHAEEIPPTPDNYTLWYVYYADSHPEVVKALNDFIAKGVPLTDDLCKELYIKYLSDVRENERVRSAGSKIQETIQSVTGAVKGVKDATHQYNETLDDVAEKLSDNLSEEELETILSAVREHTTKMMQQNTVLEEQLNQSSEVMMELQKEMDLVRKEAMTDSLTNLANRKAFDSEMRRMVNLVQEENITFCILMMDIDYFKSFNDNFGHQVGDQVLRLVAKTLTDGIKGRDVACRYGGEEFVIILPETNVKAAQIVANALRKAVAGKEVINRNSGEKMGRITLSGGIAEYIPGEKIEDLIERADQALYSAKHNGRNQIAVAAGPH